MEGDECGWAQIKWGLDVLSLGRGRSRHISFTINIKKGNRTRERSVDALTQKKAVAGTGWALGADGSVGCVMMVGVGVGVRVRARGCSELSGVRGKIRRTRYDSNSN